MSIVQNMALRKRFWTENGLFSPNWDGRSGK